MKKEFYLYECGCYVIIILASAFQLALTEGKWKTLYLLVSSTIKNIFEVFECRKDETENVLK